MMMSNYTVDTFKPLIEKLVKRPEFFSVSDLEDALDHLFALTSSPHSASAAQHVQVGAFLTALHLSHLDRRPEMLVAAAASLRARALKADVEGREADFIVDIVGTGGDGHNTFNVSTTAAVVAAGAGARVCKHGSRASTSSSGSADLLESLGCLFTPPTASTPFPISRTQKFTFILAPHYHPSLAALAPFRRALPFRTFFNVLGPLINPARPHGLVLGVAEPDLGMPFAQSLRDAGVRRALVVCGAEHLDEISCEHETHVWELTLDGKIARRMVHPTIDFGLPTHPLEDVASGTPVENSETLRVLLTSGLQGVPERLVPVMDFVLLNASALLVVAGLAMDYKQGVGLARESVVSGKAWEALQKFKLMGEQVAAAAAATAATAAREDTTTVRMSPATTL